MTTQLSLAIPLTATQRKRKRAMQKATHDHRALIALLGGKCAWCEATWADCPLQIDHMDGRHPWEDNGTMRNKRWDVRVKKYWREFREGVRLQVLCKDCNSKDGRRRQMEAQEAAKTCPF